MSKIHVIHENREWSNPLIAALERRGLPYEDWFLDEGKLDLGETPPEGVFYNRKIMFQHRTTRTMLLNQHKAINDALQKRDATAARNDVFPNIEADWQFRRRQVAAVTLVYFCVWLSSDFC